MVNEPNAADVARKLIKEYGSNGHDHAASIEEFRLTDWGNAKRLVARHGNDLRYCYPLDSWFVWCGTHWKLDDTGEVRRRAKDTVKHIYMEAADELTQDRREALGKHAIRSESESKISAMIQSAQSEPGMQVIPADLDSDIWLLNTPSGTLDLRKGTVQPHRREDMITMITAAPYDPDAYSDSWESFVADISDAEDDLMKFLQVATGASLSGSAVELFFFAHGPKWTGKSTFLESIGAVLGDYASTADFETFLQRDRAALGPRPDLVRLRGKRFVKSVEVADGRKLAAGLLKMLTGGDTVTFRNLYSGEIEFRPQFTLWLAANDAPRASGDDDALWRRLLRVPFTHEFTNPDPNIKRELTDVDKSGAAILAWAVEGCRRWLAEGITIPQIVVDATDEYKQENDPLGGFIDEHCTTNPDHYVFATDLYKEYKQYCESEGIKYPLTATKFGKKMSGRFKKDRVTAGIIYTGIGLRSSDEE